MHLVSFVDAYFDPDTNRARLSNGRFISNRAARGIFLANQASDLQQARLMRAADTISADYGGSSTSARLRIAEWLARREEGVEDDQNPFPSP